MAADWARKNTREGQITASLAVINAIATMQHISGVVVNKGLNTHSQQLRESLRVISAALDERHRTTAESASCEVSEEVERVAKAIARASIHSDQMAYENVGLSYDQWVEKYWAEFLPEAHAALSKAD